MASKKCSKCDRLVFSQNSTECHYCLSKNILPGDNRELYVENPVHEKSFCTECGERNYRNEPTCEFCNGIVRMAGGGIFPTPSAVSAVTSASVATLSGEALDPLEKLSQQIERVIEAQNRTTNLILLIAEYFLGVFFWTFIFMWNFTRQLRDNSDAYLYFTWIIYLGGLGFFTHRARQKLYEFNLKSK
jgi:hypothetical protein